METLRNKQKKFLEIKSVVEIKEVFKGFISRLNKTEERIKEHKEINSNFPN